MVKIIVGVLTISDTCQQDPLKDYSGTLLKELICKTFENLEIITDILPDNLELINSKLRQLVSTGANVIFTTGGTGFAPRDVTPEATLPLITKECPQLAMAIFLNSFQKTKFAALSRGLCGISENTLILNFPGSEKAVIECFNAVYELLPHALHLISNNLDLVTREHATIQNNNDDYKTHSCKGNCRPDTVASSNRQSIYPMISFDEAVAIIFQTLESKEIDKIADTVSPINNPPFHASIKDGYAMKSSGFAGVKKVMGCISAGDKINLNLIQEDECFKINTGAPIPQCADCVIQIEDTKLLKLKDNGDEDLVEILEEPKPYSEIRLIGSDLRKGEKLFPTQDNSQVIIQTMMASVGLSVNLPKLKIGILSTGSELLSHQSQYKSEGKVFDSNTIMLEKLLLYFGFDCTEKSIVNDEFDLTERAITKLFEKVDYIICTGGVSMGDKDCIKPALAKLGFKIKFGRVNIKPGKPMCFATNHKKVFFALPGNPVSAFVTFHLFVLPGLRRASNWTREKSELAVLNVKLQNEKILLDPRPEFMRAKITSKNGILYAEAFDNQISSRLQSIVGADALIHLPARTEEKLSVVADDLLRASILRYDFISKYE